MTDKSTIDRLYNVLIVIGVILFIFSFIELDEEYVDDFCYECGSGPFSSGEDLDYCRTVCDMYHPHKRSTTVYGAEFTACLNGCRYTLYNEEETIEENYKEISKEEYEETKSMLKELGIGPNGCELQ